jgi:glycosyltransferase involved in cell wall biosynthesis
MGDYRQVFLEELEALAEGRHDYEFLVGREYFERSVRTAVSASSVEVHDRNRFVLGRRLLWQTGVVKRSLEADVAIVELNPRILSTWSIILGRRLLGRPTLAWGHAWSRSGPSARTEPVRKAMRQLSNGMLLYTRSQSRELAASGHHAPAWVATNSLYRIAEMQVLEGAEGRADILVVGRLVPGKKVHLVIKAFARALDQLPASARLVVVGQGPSGESLEKLAMDYGIRDRVTFAGHVADHDALARLYGRAACSVSAGYVGLSLIQSLGFGVPMVYALDEPHAPEIEAANASNSLAVPSDDPAALAAAIVNVASGRAGLADGQVISDECRQVYSATAMAQAFLDAVDGVRPR